MADCLNLASSETSLATSLVSVELPNVDAIQVLNGLTTSTSEAFFGGTLSSSVILALAVGKIEMILVKRRKSGSVLISKNR